MLNIHVSYSRFYQDIENRQNLMRTLYNYTSNITPVQQNSMHSIVKYHLKLGDSSSSMRLHFEIKLSDVPEDLGEPVSLHLLTVSMKLPGS